MSYAIMAASAVLNVVFGVAIYNLRTENTQAADLQLRPGAHVGSVVGADVWGNPQAVDFPSSLPTVLYVFSPSCRYCQKTDRSVTSLALSIRHKVRFIGLSLDRDGLFDWIALRRPVYPVITDLPYRFFLTYDITSTPTTLVISRTGVVEKVWSGAYVGTVHDEIEKYFGVSIEEAAE